MVCARRLSLAPFVLVLVGVLLVAAAPAGADGGGRGETVVVGYESVAALERLRFEGGATVVRRLPALRAVELRPRGGMRAFRSSVEELAGIRYAEPAVARTAAVEPALVPASGGGDAYEWQFAATHANAVEPAVLRAAAGITIAVIDTGADLAAPDLAAKQPGAHSVLTGTADVTDLHGHGTAVASLAAGSVSNGDGMSGFGGDARLLVVQAGNATGVVTDADAASAIIYAVDHGAKIVNLSFAGATSSTVERSAVDYAVARGVLLVAAAGNGGADGNPVQYPAALLQPPDSNGRGGVGLAVGASTREGVRASFSGTGSFLSLAAPGEHIFAAASTTAGAAGIPLPGAAGGLFGYASGTSYAAPQVAGAAALVWAARPSLTAQGVAAILKETATGAGAWNPELGYGVLDVAAAVAKAQGREPAVLGVELVGERSGGTVRLSWAGTGAERYTLRVARDGGPEQVVTEATTRTSSLFAVAAGHSYVFRVTAVNWGGLSTISRPLTVSVPVIDPDRTTGRAEGQPVRAKPPRRAVRPKRPSAGRGTSRLVARHAFR